jgi:hypothetical protein
MVKSKMRLEVKGMPTRCMIPETAGVRVASDFTLKAEIRPFVIGGLQTIFSKRVPLSTGNRPGLVMRLNGSMVELLTFADGGDDWVVAKTGREAISTGEYYKILVYRSGGKAKIFVNGIEKTDPKHNTAAVGDLNCDMDVFIGLQVYDTVAEREVMRTRGEIYMIGLYEDVYFNAAKPQSYQKNPNVIPLSKLPEMKERLGIEQRRRAYG